MAFKCTVDDGFMCWELGDLGGAEAINCSSVGDITRIETPDDTLIVSDYSTIKILERDYDIMDLTPIIDAVGVVPHMKLAVCSRIVISKEWVEYDLGWYLGVQWDGDLAILRCGAYHRDDFDIVLDVQTDTGCIDGRFWFTFNKADWIQSLQEYECEHGACD